MKLYAFAYLGFSLCYLVMDAIWLGLVAKDSYAQAMQGMLREEFPVTPWITFYLLYSAAVSHLVVVRSRHAPASSAFFDGAIFGMAAYGAYNLTNYAILDGWPLGITLQDWLWGTFVTATSSLCGWFVLQKFYRSPKGE